MRYQYSFLKTTPKNAWKALAILLTGLVLTISGTLYTHYDDEQEAHNNFKFICNDLKSKIFARLQAHALLLRTGSAFFAASDSVSHEDWRNFYERATINKNLPGIQGLGFAMIIPKKDLQQHIIKIRKQGYPEYTVKPMSERSVYTSIIYLEPFSGRNLRAFGFDMFSEPRRRKAMELSRDSDVAMLSDKVFLIQETDKDVQAGALMYVPVYKKGRPANTMQERRAAIIGWVYSPYRMNDLMQGILERWDMIQQGRIHLQIYDNDSISKESLLYDSQKNDTLNLHHSNTLEVILPIEFNNKRWTLYFTQINERTSRLQGKVFIVFVCGILISLLLLTLSLSLFNTQYRANQIAEQLTAALKEEKERFSILLNSSAEAIYGLDLHGNCTFSNKACIQMLGYENSQQLTGKNMHQLLHHSHADGSIHAEKDCNIFKAFKQSKGSHIDSEVFWKADGTSFPVEYWSYPVFINGIITGAVISFFDITERKVAQTKIQLSEEKFSKLFYINPSACGLSDLITGKYIEVNEAFYNLFGIDNQEAIGKTPIELGIATSETIDEILKNMDQNGNINNFESNLIAKNGEIKHVLLSAGNVEVQDTKYRFTVVHDITIRKQAEEALQHSNRKLEAIISASPDGIGMVSLDGKLQLVSDKLAMIYGYTCDNNDQFIGKTIFEFIDPSDHNLLRTNMHNLLADNLNHKISEYLAVRKDHSHFYVDVNSSVLFDSKGNPASILFVERDITERKHAKEALEQASTRLALATRAGGVGVWDLDIINNKLLWDTQMFALYGIAKDDFNGAYETWLAGVHPNDVVQSDIEIQMAIRNEKEFDTEFRVCWPDGTVHNIRALGRVQRNESGFPLHMIGTNWDITEQKQNEEALLKSKHESEMANKAKSEFLANMSHEIRTPMNAILGFSEALYHKVDSPQHKKMLKSILSSGNLLLSLLNDILDLSKIEAGKLEISLQPLDLNSLLQEIILMFRDKAQLKGLSLNVIIDPDFPDVILLDELRIKQIIFNLVGNAIKFTHQGYVSIHVSFSNTQENFGQMLLEVKDSGIGIPNEQQQIIFEAFRQQSGQSTRVYGGVGLGLAISKRLVEKMNGEITLTSTENKGSIFSIVFPSVEISSEVRKKDTTETNQQVVFAKATILVVDDVISNIETIENLLSSSGLLVTSVESGEMALKQLENTTPDLILLDMRMPGIDGYEVAKRIKANPEKKQIPLIAFTASVFSAEKIEKSALFDGYLYKPVKRNDLFTQLKKHFKFTIQDEQPQTALFGNLELTINDDELFQKLPEIFKILEDKLMPQWEIIKDTLVLFRIDAFSDELRSIAVSYKFKYLIDYANCIRDDIEIIDVESLKITLYNFPEILKKISKLIESKKYE